LAHAETPPPSSEPAWTEAMATISTNNRQNITLIFICEDWRYS
jgi:hypothetical protein